jgi:hypothetical protein
MQHVETIEFEDRESGSKAFIFLRVDAETVAFGIAVETNGDIDIAMDFDACRALMQALEKVLPNKRG